MDEEIRHPLAYARHERGWSQEELARRIRCAAHRRGLRSGVRGSRIYKWETGRARPDAAESQPLIAEVFGIDYAAVAHLGWPHWLPDQDKPLPLGQHHAGPALREALMSAVDRRSFLAYSSGAVVVLAQQWADTDAGPALSQLAGRHVDGELVTWLEHAGTQLLALPPAESQNIARLVDAHLATVTDLIEHGRYTRPVGNRLHTLAAALATAAGWQWQRFDQRQHAAASRFWHAALHNAHAAGQRDLGAGILSDMAYQLLWLDEPGTAAAILQHAIPRTQHPTARSMLHMRHARTQAALGDAPACRRALNAAEKNLAAHASDPAPAWCAWMSHADLVMDSGRCRADLGQTRDAQRLIAEGVAALPAARSKTRAVFLAYEAENHLRAGDPEHAAAAATASLALGQSINASRCVRMVRDLEPRFARHADVADVGELLETLRAAG